jgi:hypothetical protein
MLVHGSPEDQGNLPLYEMQNARLLSVASVGQHLCVNRSGRSPELQHLRGVCPWSKFHQGRYSRYPENDIFFNNFGRDPTSSAWHDLCEKVGMNALSFRTQNIAIAIVASVSIAAATGCAGNVEGSSEENLEQAQTDEAANLKLIADAASVDIEEVKVVLPRAARAPKSAVNSFRSAKGPALGGVDWFQKWSGGVSSDHNWDKGTEFGKRCMAASTARFEAIMKDAPEELVVFLEQYKAWGGSFYNWVDDYSGPDAFGDASNPRLWAWRTGLTKWIAQTAKDGTCLLPTRKMVVEYVAVCRSKLSEDPENPGMLKGEIQGASR